MACLPHGLLVKHWILSWQAEKQNLKYLYGNSDFTSRVLNDFGQVFSSASVSPSSNETNDIYSLCQAPPDHLAFQMTFH